MLDMILSPELSAKINKFGRLLSNPGYLTSCNKNKKCTDKALIKRQKDPFRSPFSSILSSPLNFENECESGFDLV